MKPVLTGQTLDAAPRSIRSIYLFANLRRGQKARALLR
jgi:hypothetical protein